MLRSNELYRHAVQDIISHGKRRFLNIRNQFIATPAGWVGLGEVQNPTYHHTFPDKSDLWTWWLQSRFHSFRLSWSIFPNPTDTGSN